MYFPGLVESLIDRHRIRFIIPGPEAPGPTRPTLCPSSGSMLQEKNSPPQNPSAAHRHLAAKYSYDMWTLSNRSLPTVNAPRKPAPVGPLLNVSNGHFLCFFALVSKCISSTLRLARICGAYLD